ncbi:MAG: hypothetical protein C0483_03010 [Pirellula sp.]|nr:hypothetical protein [Pirellula sp.]
MVEQEPRDMTVCLVCKESAVAERLDLGLQPASNRFLTARDNTEYRHPLAISVCEACGLVQLVDPMPADEARPRVDWIVYNEPESHLDDLAKHIAQLPGVPQEAVVLGVSRYDEPALRRLQTACSARVRLLSPRDDLDITAPGAAIETLQQRLTSVPAEALVSKHGRADVVTARYILEHAHDPVEFIANLVRLAAPGGYVLIEVPNASSSLQGGDYSTLWEEHTCYFTPATLRVCLAAAGLTPAFMHSYPCPGEDALVAVCRVPGASRVADAIEPNVVAHEVARARRFLDGFAERKRSERAFFARESRRGKIALLGAGHATCAFINLFQLAEFITLVIDDNPKKQGLLMPGSQLPIRGSAALKSEQVGLCLMGVRAEIEDVIVAKNQDFLESGGQFASLNAGSRYARRAA